MDKRPFSSSRQEYLQVVWSQNPYPTAHPKGMDFDLPHSCGRLVELGKDFLELSSNDIRQRLNVQNDLELAPGFRWHDCLQVGDLIEVECQSGEASWHVSAIKLLVPSQKANPFNESSFDCRRGRQWQSFMAVVRNFFKDQDFIELRTPTLVPSPGLEPHLDPFETEFKLGRKQKKIYLPTSPEFHLKKALTLGFEKCFEFKECFRNNELSQHHQPEFLMLEWYRAYQDNLALMTDVKNLLKALQEKLLPASQSFETSIVSMEDLWRKHLDFELTPQTTVEQLRVLAKRVGVEFDPEENFDDLFARIFLERLEPVLANHPEPVILYHFPPSQAALARLTPEGWADRFELYWRGLEIANAFHELNDANEQRQRFTHDQEKKRSLDKKVVPLDEEFMDALEWGMPPSAGIALGVERLFMALFEIKTLDEVRLFPMKRPTIRED